MESLECYFTGDRAGRDWSNAATDGKFTAPSPIGYYYTPHIVKSIGKEGLLIPRYNTS